MRDASESGSRPAECDLASGETLASNQESSVRDGLGAGETLVSDRVDSNPPTTSLGAGRTLPQSEGDSRPTQPFPRARPPLENRLAAGDDAPWDPATLPVTAPGKRYALSGEVARGGIGRVLKARDRRLARPIAIKELLDSTDPAIRRFLREAQITARLEHPSIVPVHDVGRWPDGTPFYSMKLVHGRSLEVVVGECHTLPRRLALVPNLIAVAEAIAYAHSHGVIHRDLKPLNILIGSFGETLVIDWGLAKALDEDDAPPEGGPFRVPEGGLTMEGSILGTPEFMPPEQARGEPVDARADVYALGAILYFVLAGTPPFPRGRKVLERVLLGPPPPLQDRVPGAPPDLVAIADKAMARDPADRYASARDVASDLRRFQTGRLVAARHYRRRDLVRRWLVRHRGMVAIASAALAATVVFAALSFQRVAAERDVANAQRAATEVQRSAAEEQRTLAEQRGDALTLLHARSRLADDPTAALAWLKTYPTTGEGWTEVREIAERAEHLGVARAVWRHRWPVRTMAFSPDGRRLAIGTRGAGLLLRDLATGSQTVLIAQQAPTEKIAFAPRGGALATAGADFAARIWASTDGPGRVLTQHDDTIVALAFSSDGRAVMTASRDGALRLTPIDGGAPSEHRLHADGVRTAALSPDGSLVASTGGDRRVRLWNPQTGATRTLAMPNAVTWVEFTATGNAIAAGDADGLVRIWSRSGELRTELRGHTGAIIAGRFFAGGRALATAGRDETLRLWDLDTGTPRLIPLGATIVMLEARADDRSLVVGAMDGSVTLVRASGSVKKLRGHAGPAQSAAFSPRGNWLATGSEAGGIRLWELAPERGRVLGRLPDAMGFAVSSDGSTIVGGSVKGALGVHRDATWTELRSATTAILTGLDIAADGRRFVAAHGDGSVWAWELAAAGWTQRELAQHGEGMTAATLSSDGAIISAGADGSVRRHAPQGESEQLLAGEAPLSVAVAADDGRFAIAGEAGQILLWRPGQDQPERLEGHGNRVRHLAFAPHGGPLASASYDMRVKLWPASGEATVLRGHLGPVLRVAFSRDGALLASGGVDGVIRLWRADSGEAIGSIAHGRAVWEIVFSPDGRRIAASSIEGSTAIWDLDGSASDGLPGLEGAATGLAFVGDELIASDERGALRAWRLSDGRPPGATPSDPESLRAWLAIATSATTNVGDPEQEVASPHDAAARQLGASR